MAGAVVQAVDLLGGCQVEVQLVDVHGVVHSCSPRALHKRCRRLSGIVSWPIVYSAACADVHRDHGALHSAFYDHGTLLEIITSAVLALVQCEMAAARSTEV